MQRAEVVILSCIFFYSINNMILSQNLGAETAEQPPSESGSLSKIEAPWISMEVSVGPEKCIVYQEGSFKIREWSITIKTSIPVQILYGEIKKLPPCKESKISEVWITRYPDAYSLSPDTVSKDMTDIEVAWIPFSVFPGKSEVLPVPPEAFFPQTVSFVYYIMRRVKFCGAEEEWEKLLTINLIPLPLNLTTSPLLLKEDR